jgi:hypothetical protein
MFPSYRAVITAEDHQLNTEERKNKIGRMNERKKKEMRESKKESECVMRERVYVYAHVILTLNQSLKMFLSQGDYISSKILTQRSARIRPVRSWQYNKYRNKFQYTFCKLGAPGTKLCVDLRCSFLFQRIVPRFVSGPDLNHLQLREFRNITRRI